MSVKSDEEHILLAEIVEVYSCKYLTVIESQTNFLSFRVNCKFSSSLTNTVTSEANDFHLSAVTVLTFGISCDLNGISSGIA